MQSFDIPLENRVLGELILAQVERTPSKIYLSSREGSWTYESFLRESQSLAHGLRSLGVGRQTRVLLLLKNRAEFMVAYWALAFLNAVVVPINTALEGDGLGYLFKDTEASVALVDAALLPAVRALKPECVTALRQVGVLDDFAADPDGGFPVPCVAYRDLVDAHLGHGLLCEAAHFDDLNLISYTSGTTGPAKGVMIPYAQSIQTSLTCIRAVGITPDDVIFAPLPLFHGMSRTMGTVPALLLGAQAHVAPRFGGSTFWRDVAEVGATVAVTIFTIPPTLKSLPPSAHDRAHRLRVMFNAHHDPAFEDRFGTRIVEAHGMTEVGLTVYSSLPERREGSAGRAGADWDVQLVDEYDRPVPIGTPGEMVVRPKRPSIMMKAYLNKPDQTALATRNLWFHTGDYMLADADGFLYYAGRKKERIRRRGENISAFDVESCADQHADVVESAAVAFPAGDGEDEIRLVAVIQQDSDLTPAKLAHWLDGRLARFMRPRYVEFVTQLPKTGSGKLEKYRLVEAPLSSGCWDREAGASAGRTSQPAQGGEVLHHA